MCCFGLDCSLCVLCLICVLQSYFFSLWVLLSSVFCVVGFFVDPSFLESGCSVLYSLYEEWFGPCLFL